MFGISNVLKKLSNLGGSNTPTTQNSNNTSKAYSTQSTNTPKPKGATGASTYSNVQKQNASISRSNSPSYGSDASGSYKIREDGSKVYMNDSNKQYFPNDYGGSAGWNTGGSIVNKPSNNTPSYSSGSTVKPYETSDKNKQMYGNNYSTHLWQQGNRLDPNRTDMNVDKNGLFVSNKFEIVDGQLVQTNTKTGQQWVMGDDTTHDYASEIVNADGTVTKTGGTGGFGYNAKTGVTYKLGDQYAYDKANDSMYDIWGMEGSDNADKQQARQEHENYLKSLSPEKLAEVKANSNSVLEKNYISSLDGTALNDSNYNYSPIAIMNEGQQVNLQNIVYDAMRQNGGVEDYNGTSTLSVNEVLNKSGLGGMFNVNQVTEPLIQELMIQQEAEANGYDAELQIDPKVILDEIAKNGGLKEGYTYDQATGNVGVDSNYVQVGDILMDKMTFVNNYGQQEHHMANQVKHEGVAGQMTETPLEARAKLAPDTMTPEMQADLQMERDIKTQLEQLKLDLSFLDELGSSGGTGMTVMASGVGGGTGSATDTGTQLTQTGTGTYGNGGGSEFNWQQSGGRGAVYGTSNSTSNANNAQLQALYRKIGGMK